MTPIFKSCIKAVQNSSVTIHPCVCSFYGISFPIQQFIKNYTVIYSSVPFIDADISRNSIAFEHGAKDGTIKSASAFRKSPSVLMLVSR